MNKELFDRFINGEIGINTQTKQEYLDLLKYLGTQWATDLTSAPFDLGYIYHAGNTCLHVEDGSHLFFDSKDFYIYNKPDLEIVECSELLSSKMTVEELRDLLLENFVDECGDLNVTGLDFSEFDGDVVISGMAVKGDLFQSGHSVGKNLYQGSQKVGGDLFQSYQEVGLSYACTDVKYGVLSFVNEPQKILKELTVEELEKLGYKLKEENK